MNTVFTLFKHLLPTPPMFSWFSLFFKFMISSTINIFIYSIIYVIYVIVWHTYVYNLLSSFECGLYVHVFGAVYLRLDNLLGSSSLEKTDPSSLSSHWLTITLYLWVGLCNIFPIHIGISPCAVIGPLCRSCQF